MAQLLLRHEEEVAARRGREAFRGHGRWRLGGPGGSPVLAPGV